jgi:hypothetical protein
MAQLAALPRRSTAAVLARGKVSGQEDLPDALDLIARIRDRRRPRLPQVSSWDLREVIVRSRKP